jgi:hypothetical protein
MTMKSSNETTFPYLVVSIALGIIAAILLVPRSEPMTLQYILQEGRDKLRSFLIQAINLRNGVYRVRKKETQFKGRGFNSVEIASEAEKQAYEAQKRKYPGG